MLYKAERMSELLPNSSALAVFSMLCTLQCREDLAFETQQLGRKMGERMKLFGVANEGPNRTHFHNMSPKMKIASAQVAWGLYSWLRCVVCAVKPIPVGHRSNAKFPAACVLSSTKIKLSTILRSYQSPVVFPRTDANGR